MQVGNNVDIKLPFFFNLFQLFLIYIHEWNIILPKRLSILERADN